MLPDCTDVSQNTLKLSTHHDCEVVEFKTICIIIFFSLFCTLFLPLHASAAAHQITYWADNKAGAVSVTFDDGEDSQYDLAVPALNARGLKGTFFISTAWASWDEWRDTASQGHEIGSHTINHLNLPQLSLAEMEEEIGGSQDIIDAQITTQQCLTFAHPFGAYDNNTMAIAEVYYIAARGISCDLNTAPYDFYNMRACEDSFSLDQMISMTNDAEQQGEWLITFHHG